MTIRREDLRVVLDEEGEDLTLRYVTDAEVLRLILTEPCQSNDCEDGRLWDDIEMPCPDCFGKGYMLRDEYDIDNTISFSASWLEATDE